MYQALTKAFCDGIGLQLGCVSKEDFELSKNSLENELQRDVDELIVRNLKFSVRKGIAYLWITIEPSTALLTPRSMKGCKEILEVI